MADLDLRALSAPLEALRDDVKAAYERLDAQWEAIASQLRALPIPCEVEFTYWSSESGNEQSSLAFKKWNGKKRICMCSDAYYGREEECTTTPYEEWSGQERIAMLEHVPALFEAAVKGTKKFIARTQSQETQR